MKKLLFVISFIVSTNFLSEAQYVRTISADSLLKKFQVMDAFEVLDSTNIYVVDIKDCYYNQKLKPYLLKWLDKEAYFTYENNNSIRIAYTDDYKVIQVREWLINHKQKHLIDTVLKTPALFNIYLDSVITDETNYMKKLFYKYGGGRLRSEILNFHSLLKLPEAYTILRKYWEEDSCKIKSDYLRPMLAMHDPDAIEKYNKYVDSIITTNDLSAIESVETIADYEYEFGSYATDLQVKLLNVTIKTYYSYSFENNFDVPFNVNFLSPSGRIYYHFATNDTISKILNKIYYNPQKKIYEYSYKELEEYSNEIVKNIEKFKEAIQEHKNKLIKEEEYWKKNMPYNKKN
jgi:hypothetical protein